MSSPAHTNLEPPVAADHETPDETTDHITDTILEELPFLEGALEASFWEDLRDSLPSWLDELIAIGLLIFSLLSFLALFDASGTVVAAAWANVLRQLFGSGSWLIVSGIFLFGVLIFVPKAGIQIQYRPGRILAIELIILCVLALLHLYDPGGELRTIARVGSGGGVIGWGLAAFPDWLIGRTASMVLYSIVLVLSIAVVAGLRRDQILDWLDDTGQRCLMMSETLSGAANRVTVPGAAPSPERVVALSGKRTPLMRIVPDLQNLPPSVRRDILEEKKPSNRRKRERQRRELESHPLFQAKVEDATALKVDFNQIGEKLDKKTEDGHQLVRRPDGREKRYFSVQAMQEEKKIARRKKDLPVLDILSEEAMQLPAEDEINRNAVLIENTLLEFDIDIDVISVQAGPTVTRYAVQPYRLTAEGNTERTRLNKIASYQNDLALALSAKRLRLEIPVPGTKYMGIEVPNQNPSKVTLRSIYESKSYYDLRRKSDSPLTIPLGRDVAGRPIAIDLAKMPHLLIAGTTGSGKSVAIAAMAAALLLDNKPNKVKMVMMDPKMVELSRFNGLPHLIGPVETDTDRIIGVLKWCTREMDRRYKVLEEHAVRNITNYNQEYGKRRRGKDYMPHIVIFIDEIGDLMMQNPEDTERSITRLAQMARAVGMHMVIATQRPSVDVITGLIKANFPGRIGFSVASGVDSRVILDAVGAEQLMGGGDMLYLSPDAGAPKRVQGCFVSDEEVREIVNHWRNWYEQKLADGKLNRKVVGPWERGLTKEEFLAETDPMLEQAIEFVIETREASASTIQRHLNLGYPRAARIVDLLYEIGVVGEPVAGGRTREVLIPQGEDPFERIIERRVELERQRRSEALLDDDDFDEDDDEYDDE